MRQPGTAAAAQAPTLRLLLNVVNFSPFRSATNSMRPTTVLSAPNDGFPPKIGIGGHLAMPPLPHHRAYGSVPRRFDWVKLWQTATARSRYRVFHRMIAVTRRFRPKARCCWFSAAAWNE
jgi:hypothetical protein